MGAEVGHGPYIRLHERRLKRGQYLFPSLICSCSMALTSAEAAEAPAVIKMPRQQQRL